MTIVRMMPAVAVAFGALAGAALAQPPGPARPAGNPDMRAFVHAVDADGDGRLTQAEWVAAGAPDSAFRMLSAAHPGYVTQADLDTNQAPPGIDLNGDGQVTLEEFKAFDRQHAKAQPAPAPR